MALGLLARKRGMTTLVDEAGQVVPVTVLTAGPCTVVAVRTPETHGYGAVQLGFEPETRTHRTSRPRAGHFAAAKVPVHRELQEFRCDDAGAVSPGQQLTVAGFRKGDVVDVCGRTKGRGFQGVIKRWGKAGGPASHGSHFHRTTGSIGMRTWPGRIFKNMKMPGHLGNVRCTTRGLIVVDVDPALHLLFVKGGVPGPKNGLVRIIARDAEFAGRAVMTPTEAPNGAAA